MATVDFLPFGAQVASASDLDLHNPVHNDHETLDFRSRLKHVSIVSVRAKLP
jgi:hypothetical protein